MLSVLRVHLPSETPIVGCVIAPYILILCPDESVIRDDIPESAPLYGHYVKYRWYRIPSDQIIAVCSVHPSQPATLQCEGCVKARIPIAKSYHCTPRCFKDAWQHHRALHDRANSCLDENVAKIGSTGYGGSNAALPGSASRIRHYPATNAMRSGDETPLEIGCSRTYTPTVDDIGHVLKFECVVIEAKTRESAGTTNTHLTSHVIPAPSPSPRSMIQVNRVDMPGSLDPDRRTFLSGTFTVLSYNILSDAYAPSELYSYCPSWALSWNYRKQSLLREIIGYNADILCLQEVQSDHFEEFFAPQLETLGYQAFYKKKTSEVYNGNIHSIDGCATFVRRDRFSLVKKYEVEFNKFAQHLIDPLKSESQKKLASNRFIKDDIALIVVLEAKLSNHGTDNPGKKRLLCVANTHLNSRQDHKEVMIWQVHTLVKGLDKIAASGDIPLLVCGDFDSVPGSAPHELLAKGKIDESHPDLGVDPLQILKNLIPSILIPKLPLVSAYSSFAMSGLGHNLEQQRRKMDPITNEPLFTNCTRNFFCTHDYIFYTERSLTVESLLELLDEKSLRKNTALPSPELSSDHIALLAEFRWKSGNKR